MTCEEARILMAEELDGIRPADPDLQSHLSRCESCRAEANLVQTTWQRLADLPAPQPGPWVGTRFYAALDAYQRGAQESRMRTWKWWPSRPLWQAAISLGCLALGIFSGTLLTTARSGTDEIAELRKEMTGMRQLVTLSLLQQQSATERLQGVNWSYRVAPNDLEVLSALLRTVDEDTNVDVRLAAVDALRNFADSTVARRGLTNALRKQSSPLVQLAIVDALADIRDRSAAPSLRQLLDTPGVDENVRRRAERALRTIQ
jgi:hypothetical protein